MLSSNDVLSPPTFFFLCIALCKKVTDTLWSAEV
jgi:hypothetical protein